MAVKRSPKAGVPMNPFMLPEGVEIDICPVTKGIWLDLGELRVLTGLESDLPFFKDAVASSTETIWPSPVANCRLREIRFHPAREVVIDYCPASGGIWLDKGELDKLKDIAGQIGDPKSKVLGIVKSMAESVRSRSLSDTYRPPGSGPAGGRPPGSTR
jgi:Zn-finger nucleic acid-binding protein